MRRIFISPVLQRGVGRGLPVLHFPASGAGPSAAGWKVEEAQTIEAAPALKHGANENAESVLLPLENS